MSNLQYRRCYLVLTVPSGYRRIATPTWYREKWNSYFIRLAGSADIEIPQDLLQIWQKVAVPDSILLKLPATPDSPSDTDTDSSDEDSDTDSSVEDVANNLPSE